MPSTLPRYTFRVEQEILDKLKYIADNNFRTMNNELKWLVIKHIADYEAEHGEIRIEE